MNRLLFILITALSIVVFNSCKTEEARTNKAATNLSFINLADFSSPNIGVGNAHDGLNFIYIVNKGKLERYNIALDKWETLSNHMMPAQFGSAELVNDKLFSFDGELYSRRANNKKMLIYDLTSNTISYGTPNPHPSEYAGSAVWNNKIYTFGGSFYNGESIGYHSDVHAYDIATDSWSLVTHMPDAKQTEGEIVNGKLYVFGGFNGGTSRSIDVYDIASDTWEHTGELPFPISAHSTSVEGDKIWIIGSYDKQDLIAYFDTNTGEFKTFNSSNFIERRHAGSAVINQKLYVFGGGKTPYANSFLDKLQVSDISGL